MPSRDPQGPGHRQNHDAPVRPLQLLELPPRGVLLGMKKGVCTQTPFMIIQRWRREPFVHYYHLFRTPKNYYFLMSLLIIQSLDLLL